MATGLRRGFIYAWRSRARDSAAPRHASGWGACTRFQTTDGTEMIMAADAADSGPGAWLALPGFDEYMLGYKDRSMMATPEQLAAIIPGAVFEGGSRTVGA